MSKRQNIRLSRHEPLLTCPTSIVISEKLKFSPRPVSRALELDKPGRLYCRATGSTPPTVGWVRILASGRPHFEWPSHVRDVNGTLEFNPVKESDGGEYSCVATNAQGFINATVTLDVVGEWDGRWDHSQDRHAGRLFKFLATSFCIVVYRGVKMLPFLFRGLCSTISK